jgi:hypothetical protein
MSWGDYWHLSANVQGPAEKLRRGTLLLGIIDFYWVGLNFWESTSHIQQRYMLN